MGLAIQRQPYDSPEAAALIAELQAEYVQRYGGVDETPVDVEQFVPPHGDFLVAAVDGRLVGCGGFRTVGDGVAEIKRMYVRLPSRGLGIGRQLLTALEACAAAAGCCRIILETGSRQPEAVALYAAGGYAVIPAFGTYRCAPGSRHLGKALRVGATESGLPEPAQAPRMSS